MSTYLVSVCVTADDDDLAREVAKSVADFAADLVEFGEGHVDTFIADPVRVTP